LRRTKIIATFGPSCKNEEIIRKLIKAGVNIFRFNFSHSNADEHINNAKIVKRIADEMNVRIAFLQDLAGPKIRIGKIKNNKVILKNDQLFKITTREIEGNEEIVSVNFKEIVNYVQKNDIILIAEGTIVLKVIEVNEDEIITRVLKGGEISSNKGLNLPFKEIDVSALTEKDLEDIKKGIQFGFDYVAVSFVQKPSDIELVRYYLRKFGSLSKIIAKIEKPSAVMRIEDIVDVSDGIMIARGDLGIEFPIEELPIIQKKFIKLCIQKGKPVITATQMLESMINNPSPTRAEVTDVANAVLDGSDALMLSGETAVGNYPVEAVSIMDKIIRKVENSIDYSKPPFRVSQSHLDINDAVAFAAYELSKFSNAKAIVAYTFSGDTARRVAKFRPSVPIVAITPNEFVANQLVLSWGVIPIVSEMVNSFEEMVNIARMKVKELGLVKELSKIVIIAGLPLKVPGNTNLIHLTDVH